MCLSRMLLVLACTSFGLVACSDDSDNTPQTTGDAEEFMSEDMRLDGELWDDDWTQNELLNCQRNEGDGCRSLYDPDVTCCELSNAQCQHSPGGTQNGDSCHIVLDSGARGPATLNADGCFEYTELAARGCLEGDEYQRLVQEGWVDTRDFSEDELFHCQADEDLDCLAPDTSTTPHVAGCCAIGDIDLDGCFYVGGERERLNDRFSCEQACDAERGEYWKNPVVTANGCVEWIPADQREDYLLDCQGGGGCESLTEDGNACCPVTRSRICGIQVGGSPGPDGCPGYVEGVTMNGEPTIGSDGCFAIYPQQWESCGDRSLIDALVEDAGWIDTRDFADEELFGCQNSEDSCVAPNSTDSTVWGCCPIEEWTDDCMGTGGSYELSDLLCASVCDNGTLPEGREPGRDANGCLSWYVLDEAQSQRSGSTEASE